MMLTSPAVRFLQKLVYQHLEAMSYTTNDLSHGSGGFSLAVPIVKLCTTFLHLYVLPSKCAVLPEKKSCTLPVQPFG